MTGRPATPAGATGGPGPERPPRLTVAELASNTGRRLGTSRWLTISAEDVAAFAEATGDRQWIHLDAPRAFDGPFGAPIAHGFLLLTTTARLFPEILAITDRSMSINYGTEEVRFPAPVRVGSSVRLSGVLAGVEERPGGAKLIRVATELELAGSVTPAATAVLLFVVQAA